MSGCPGRARHWFSVWGTVGLRSPVCTSCGAPNPRPLNDDEWFDLVMRYRDGGWVGGEHVRKAVTDHLAAEGRT